MNPACRIVVTGIGLVTPLGVGTQASWSALMKGVCAGTSTPTTDGFKAIPSKVCTKVPEGTSPNEFDWATRFTSTEKRQMSRASAFAILAADEAIADAGLVTKQTINDSTTHIPSTSNNQGRWGTSIGSSIMDVDDIHATGDLLDNAAYKRISPYFIPRVLTNMPAGMVSMRHGLTGPCLAPTGACATGAMAIGDAGQQIERNSSHVNVDLNVDVMLAGGTDACISPIVLGGFSRLRALSTKFNDNPRSSSRPFDTQRDGFVMGEGAGVLVLETLSHALSRRRGKIYAELMGFGLSADASHMTSPDASGAGAITAMRAALFHASIAPSDVGYVNAHATSTPMGDAIEARAIAKALCEGGSKTTPCWVSSNKGSLGHLQGAAGAVEAAFTILSLYHGLIPPNVNCDEPERDIFGENISDTAMKLAPAHGVTEWPTGDAPRIALCNSFGFGGINACLVFKQFKL